MKTSKPKPTPKNMPLHYKVLEDESPEGIQKMLEQAWRDGYMLWSFSVTKFDDELVYTAVMRIVTTPSARERQAYEEMQK